MDITNTRSGDASCWWNVFDNLGHLTSYSKHLTQNIGFGPLYNSISADRVAPGQPTIPLGFDPTNTDVFGPINPPTDLLK